MSVSRSRTDLILHGLRQAPIGIEFAALREGVRPNIRMFDLSTSRIVSPVCQRGAVWTSLAYTPADIGKAGI